MCPQLKCRRHGNLYKRIWTQKCVSTPETIVTQKNVSRDNREPTISQRHTSRLTILPCSCRHDKQHPRCAEGRRQPPAQRNLGSRQHPPTKYPRCSEPRRCPINCCQGILSAGTVDIFCHFRFKNQPIVEVGGDFWVMGRSWADFGGNENTLEQNTLAAENRDITK